VNDVWEDLREACDEDGCQCMSGRARARGLELEARLKSIQDKVNEQAEDEALWSVPAEGTQRIAEAYLQQELRALHKVIEGDS